MVRRARKIRSAAHFLLALQLDPECKEAITKLGLARYRGVLATPADIEAWKGQLRKSAADLADWQPQFELWRRQYRKQLEDRNKILEKIRNIRSTAAIPAMENVFGSNGRELALAAVDALKKMPNQRSTQALAKFAAFTAEKEVENAAVDALKYRRRENFLPVLLTELKTPVQLDYDYVPVSDRRFVLEFGARLSQETFSSNEVLPDDVFFAAYLAQEYYHQKSHARA